MAVGMYCYKPIVIRDKKDSNLTREVPCGKCPACRRAYQVQWIVRLKEELKHSEQSFFVTLTYSEDRLGFDKKLVQRFLNRLQHKTKYHGAHLKYFLVSEYGDTTARQHHHALLFLDKYIPKYSQFIADGWQEGFITVGDVNGARINYVTGYTLKKNGIDYSDFPDHLNPDKCKFISKGLGKAYLSDAQLSYLRNGLITVYKSGDYNVKLPRYYFDKTFDELQKEEIKSLNRCYVEAYDARYLRKYGLEKVLTYDIKDKCQYYILRPIGSQAHSIFQAFTDDVDQKLRNFYERENNIYKYRLTKPIVNRPNSSL